MSLPAMSALRERFPGAHISVVARPWVADLYAREPFADEVICYPKGRRLDLIRALRRQAFDCAILLQNAFDAALISLLGGAPRRIGYDRDARRLLLTDPVPVPRRGEIPDHERFYYLELLRRAGLIERLPAHAPITLAARGEAREAGRLRFHEAGLGETVAGLSPGAAYGTAKRWLPERFVDAAAQVAAGRNASVAIFGSMEERPLCETIASSLRERGVRVRNFAGETTLSAFIDLAAACSVFLTNDSGAMHIASALEVPTVAVFGSTDHEGTGPLGSHSRVIREPVECSPCLLRECPIDHRCMTLVTADRVARVALELIR